MIAQTTDTTPRGPGRRTARWAVGLGLLAATVLIVWPNIPAAFSSSPPNAHPLPISATSLPSASLISRYWHVGYTGSSMLRLPTEVANLYTPTTPARAPYEIAVVVGTNPNYLTTPEAFTPFVMQPQAQKWRHLVSIQTSVTRGQSGWTSWTLTTTRVVTSLSARRAAADPFLSPVQQAGLHRHHFATETFQLSRPDRLSVVMDSLGTWLTPQQAVRFADTLNSQLHALTRTAPAP